MRSIKSLLAAFLLMLPMFAEAQLVRHHEMGIFGGTSNYYGDLNHVVVPKGSYAPVGSLVYKYFTHPAFGLRFSASYTELSAADSVSKVTADRLRNLNFTTNLFEASAGVEINLVKCDPMHSRFTPYVFGGLALFYFNPYTQDANNNRTYLKPLSTEGQGLPPYGDRLPYNLVNVAMPVGAGFKVLCGKKVYVNAEVGVRATFTDYLDDVSKGYVNMDSLYFYKGQQSVDLSYRTDELVSTPEMQVPETGYYPNLNYRRGDKAGSDWYWFAGVGVTVYFDSFGNLWPYRQTRCPRNK
jgi:hypothetical protein